MPLAEGAVQLAPMHLSVRVPWHDTDWTGRVCDKPGENHFCSVLKNIKENKDSETESDDSGMVWSDLPRRRVPPCVFERGGFMRESAYSIDRDHAYAGGWTRSHAHFATTTHTMPAYSFEATPYRWVMRDQAELIADIWGIQYDRSLEDRADEIIEKRTETNWVQDHRNQLAMLDSFFSAIVPTRSLVFIYAKDVPLLEDRPPGGRVLVGAGLVTSVAPPSEWEYDGTGPLRSIMWERAVAHSITPNCTDGFLLPYQQLLADPKLSGNDLARFVAIAPPDSFEEFSYVTELVSHDTAVQALTELARVVEMLPGIVDGPWNQVATWLEDRIADAWAQRGAYPGLGAVLTAAGLARGAVIAHRVVASLDDPADDPWPALESAIKDAASGKGPATGLVHRMARKAWERLAEQPERYELLRLLARFDLTRDQARRLFDQTERSIDGSIVTDSELLANPYQLYEIDRRRRDGLTLGTIDRGLFPRSANAQATLDRCPLPDPIGEAADDRRVRAACVHVLERAIDEGHTLLDEPQLRRRISNLGLEPTCDPETDLFELATDEFHPFLAETPLAESGRGWQLDRLAAAGDLIADEIGQRIHLGPLDVTWDWAQAVDEAIAQPIDPTDVDEPLARAEKSLALQTLAQARVSALVGPAGTGKTTLLKALCSQPEIRGRVLLLAPTGKARVQLGDKTGERAATLASFLRPSGRWDYEFGYHIKDGAAKIGSYHTVIVDEASMLTEEMLAALLAAVTGVDRLILCGDHRQLPPIGAGRPFADLIRHLADLNASSSAGVEAQPTGGGIAQLTIGRRQRGTTGTITGSDSGRDDLAVAAFFATDSAHPAADEAFARVLNGTGDGSVLIKRWETEEELHDLVVDTLVDEYRLAPGTSDALKESLGATSSYMGRPAFDFGTGGEGAENWQLLSPVRARKGGVDGLNRLVRRTWRRQDAASARDNYRLPPPMGADEILYHDKVMVVRNHGMKAERIADKAKVKAEVANGEIGIATWWAGNKGLKVELSTQPGLHFIFWASDLNGDNDGVEELELAYAVTVHKSQGSQFGLTFVVVPNPCPLLSPELLYTALTRHQRKCVLLIQGDPSDLRRVAGPLESETGRRLTRLFRPPSPFEAADGRLRDGAHVHRTANGELVISKSEVIVANTLRSLGVEYLYEQPLVMPDGTRRLPDFTIHRPGTTPTYWEHLGMLDKAGYRADWEAKRQWYANHGIAPWTEGGGPEGTLVWSTEGQPPDGIDAAQIEQLARGVFEESV
ncbi:AAA family ATPase [Serinicoccus kebangsaanensis]|uniref:AAA family ATPase n=1 Tax=Serinicoccus kebangsaanensis TaxID=2602069 RepID=UPI00124C2F20|nr:AAA family ATPase [Serinicoccus kebangsaanensis]